MNASEHIERLAVAIHQNSNTPSASPRPSGWGIFFRAVQIAAQCVGLLILAALLLFWVIVGDALLNAPEPETHTFDMADGSWYSRSQIEWSIEE